MSQRPKPTKAEAIRMRQERTEASNNYTQPRITLTDADIERIADRLRPTIAGMIDAKLKQVLLQVPKRRGGCG